jgi:hypothetical protein
MTDFGLGDDIVNEDRREAALALHFGTYYFLPEKPQPLELLANPPYATSKDYEPACGTGAWLAKAVERITGLASRDAGKD